MQSLLKRNIEKRQVDRTFLIDPLTTNNAIYRDSLTLKNDLILPHFAFSPLFIKYPTHAVLHNINFVVFQSLILISH